MSRPEDFSVLDTEFKLFDEGGKRWIRKKVKLNDIGEEHLKEVYEQILQYIESYKSANIPLPEVKSHKIEDGKLVFVCEYKGENVYQLIGNKYKELFNEKLNILIDILDILKLSQDAGIYFDPHIKNFVVDDKVYYVDFSQPNTEKYMDLRVSSAEESEKEIIRKNFESFNPYKVAYHFAGDLLKLDENYLEMMPKLYELMVKKGLVDSSYSEFIRQADEIKNIELERVRKNIFLI